MLTDFRDSDFRCHISCEAFFLTVAPLAAAAAASFHLAAAASAADLISCSSSRQQIHFSSSRSGCGCSLEC